MYLSKLIKELQNALDVSEEGDTSSVKVCIGDKEHEISFIDFVENKYATVDKMTVKIFVRG